jgi:hypothetical protein
MKQFLVSARFSGEVWQYASDFTYTQGTVNDIIV